MPFSRPLAAALIAVSCLTGAPAFAQKAEDYLGYCPDEDNVRKAQYEETCDELQKLFRKQFPKAMRGDYASQRNVAFWLGMGNKGPAIIQNKITACAWRFVIIASGDPEVGPGDTMNLKHDCGKQLDDVERAAAQGQANALIVEIWRR